MAGKAFGKIAGVYFNCLLCFKLFIHVAFAENGEALPRHSEKVRLRAYERARNSIEIYHLNHSDFVDARLQLKRHLEELIKRAKHFWKRLDEGNADMDEAYSNAIKDIFDHIDPNSEFSAFSKMIVDKYRDKEYLAGVA